MAQGRNTLMDPPIEDLLDKVDSKFTLVALGSARARQVNSYYNSLGEGLGKVVPPQVASVSGKPVSIAFEEIAAGKATYTRIDPEEEAALAEVDTEAEVEVEVESAVADIIEDTVLSEVLTEVAAEDEADNDLVAEAEIELLDAGDVTAVADEDPTAS
jgi:DNA-directed RNA polymerase subunit omega